jgi:outer membrane protein
VLDVSGLTALRSARQGVKAADLRRTSTRQDVALETLRRFYDVVRAVQLANVAEGTLRVARDDERRVRALFEVGSVSKSDVLKAQVRSEQSQLDSLTAKESITTTRFALAQQIGISESAMGEVDTVLAVEPRDYDEPALIAEAVKNRPDLRAAQAEVQAANASLTSARFARLPYVTLSGSVTLSPKSSQSTTTNTVDSQGNPVTIVSDFSGTDDREWRGAVALNLDLFDGLATESRTALARARVIRAREIRDALQRNLTSEVHAALLLYQEAVERTRVATRSVESAAENLNLIQQKYNVGSATILELVDAEVQLQRARSDAVSALAALRVAEAQIERVRGSGR